MFKRVLVANRGEIARRIIHSLRKLGIASVAVYSSADGGLPFVDEADVAVEIDGTHPTQAYRDVDRILQVAHRTGVDAVHPGYGFLSENAEFAESVTDSGIVWVGPRPETMRLVGDKARAREAMAAAGLPVARGGIVRDVTEARRSASEIGYPVVLKAVAGGGGLGIRVVDRASDIDDAFTSVRGYGSRLFGDPGVLLEEYLPRSRHVEVQVLGLGTGRVSTFQERECSIQRRFQKVLEETPSPAISAEMRKSMREAVAKGMENIGYLNAGTVECLVHSGGYVFLEVNARLQVEHPITELVYGVDLVAEQLRVSAGVSPGFEPGDLEARGHAIEARVNAEHPRTFMPSPGQISHWEEPSLPDTRIDAGYRSGAIVSPHNDSLLAKVCVWGEDRPSAIENCSTALRRFTIEGLDTNIPFLIDVLEHPEFQAGTYDTGTVGRLSTASR